MTRVGRTAISDVTNPVAPAAWSAGHQQRALRLRGKVFAAEDLLIMGIVNRTPDSFYDRGSTYSAQDAVALAERHLDAGAAIVDVGGVKAGRGDPVSAAEERDRVCEVIEALRSRRPDAVISIDTWRSSVARDAVAAGADLINDAWEGHDPELKHVAAESGVGLVCTHAGHLLPRTDPYRVRYDDVVTDVIGTVVRLAHQALEAGVRPDGILVDPGHDFGKTSAHSLEVTRRLGELVRTGWPVLVAMSNKDFIGETLDQPTTGRLFGTLGVTALAAWFGARVFRSHNVEPTRHVLEMVSSVRGDRPPAMPRRGLAVSVGRDHSTPTSTFTSADPVLYFEGPTASAITMQPNDLEETMPAKERTANVNQPITDDSIKVRHLSHYQFSWTAQDPGEEGVITLQLVLDQGAWEEVLTVNAEDAEVLRGLLAHGSDVSYDVQRRVLMFGTTPVGDH